MQIHHHNLQPTQKSTLNDWNSRLTPDLWVLSWQPNMLYKQSNKKQR